MKTKLLTIIFMVPILCTSYLHSKVKHIFIKESWANNPEFSTYDIWDGELRHNAIEQLLVILNRKSSMKNLVEALGIYNYYSNMGLEDVVIERLYSIIEERLDDPESEYDEVTICDIMEIDQDMNECGRISNHKEDSILQIVIEKARLSLNKKQIGLFNQIQAQYKLIQEYDSRRSYLTNVDGTIRVIAYLSVESFSISSHKSKIELFLLDKNYDTFSVADHAEAEYELSYEYGELIKHYSKMYTGIIQTCNDKQDKKRYKELHKDIYLLLSQSNKAWKKYKELWVALMTDITGSKHIGLSVSTALTFDRIYEMGYESM
ncbi:MAG: hypothetical protein ACKN9Y_09440 [Bacteroidota bacterium]